MSQWNRRLQRQRARAAQAVAGRPVARPLPLGGLEPPRAAGRALRRHRSRAWPLSRAACLSMLARDRATVRAEEAALGRTHAEVHLRAAREELELVAASALGAHHRAWIAKDATTLGRHRGAATGRLRVFSRARRAAGERARASGAMGAACAVATWRLSAAAWAAVSKGHFARAAVPAGVWRSLVTRRPRALHALRRSRAVAA